MLGEMPLVKCRGECKCLRAGIGMSVGNAEAVVWLARKKCRGRCLACVEGRQRQMLWLAGENAEADVWRACRRKCRGRCLACLS